jgi:hypothetical protein
MKTKEIVNSSAANRIINSLMIKKHKKHDKGEDEDIKKLGFR